MEKILNVYKILARSDEGHSYECELCCDINDIQKSLNHHLNKKGYPWYYHNKAY